MVLSRVDWLEAGCKEAGVVGEGLRSMIFAFAGGMLELPMVLICVFEIVPTQDLRTQAEGFGSHFVCSLCPRFVYVSGLGCLYSSAVDVSLSCWGRSVVGMESGRSW